MNTNLFLKRFLSIGCLANSPPLVLLVCAKLGVEPIIALASVLVWSNIPIAMGLDAWITPPAINYTEFVVSYASVNTIIATASFWFVVIAISVFAGMKISTLITQLSLTFKTRSHQAYTPD